MGGGGGGGSHSLWQHCHPPTLDKLSFLPPQIIGNCVSLLVLSSALPVFSRTLGEPLGEARVTPELGCPQD